MPPETVWEHHTNVLAGRGHCSAKATITRRLFAPPCNLHTEKAPNDGEAVVRVCSTVPAGHSHVRVMNQT